MDCDGPPSLLAERGVGKEGDVSESADGTKRTVAIPDGTAGTLGRHSPGDSIGEDFVVSWVLQHHRHRGHHPTRMFHHTISSTPDLLAEWRWLLGGLPRLVGWSAAGDLFYVDERARVCRLDTGAGEFEVVADSRGEFDSVLADAKRIDDLLLLPVVRAFESAHGPLPEGSCLGFTTLPVFGGGYSVENRYAVSVAEHARFTGDIHRQIRDLPDGTAIRLNVLP